MARLIDADSLTARLEKIYDTDSIVDKIMLRFLKKLIRKQPTVDTAPVVHGEWEQLCDPSFSTNFPTISRCTVCGMKYNLPNISYNYCPRCGAKMDGGDKE